MSVTIKYKGNTIASANTDTTKTLKTSGKYCEGDIVVENVQDGGITPSGSIAITENGTYDVTEYAEAVVDVSGGAEIVRKTATTVADFGYPDLPALVGNLKYQNSILICYARGDTPPSTTNSFSYTFWHHRGTNIVRAQQYYATSASKTPTQITEGTVASQPASDIRINSNGTLFAPEARKFCGAGCQVYWFEIPIGLDGTIDTTLWGA